MPRKPPPPHLYKYQAFTPQTLANLKDRQIWFNAPVRFNDPFDCALPITDPERLTDADYRRAYEYVKRRRPTSPEIDSVMCPNGVPSPAFRELILRAVHGAFEERRKVQLEQRGIACLSAKTLDIMMWSHYADGHRGFCLEFDTKVEPFDKPFQVRYSETFPYVNPIDTLVEPHEPGRDDPENDLLVALVLTKAPCWSYEEEWRVMHMEPNKLYTYDWRALTGIFFGAAMPYAHREILSLILRGSPTQAYEVRRDDKSFALQATPVTYQPFKYN